MSRKRIIDPPPPVTDRYAWMAYLLRHTEETESGCMEWLRGCCRSGYGISHRRSGGKLKAVRLNRLLWEVFYGEQAGDRFVCHTCDNPRCSNPQHLWLGDAKENTHDMMVKGRRQSSKGEQNGGAKITDEMVVKICSMPPEKTHAEIARALGISCYVVRSVRVGKAWSHVQCKRTPVVYVPRRGSQAARSRLIEPEVLRIRQMRGSMKAKDLAEEYGVTIYTVYAIWARRIWKHI